MTTTCPYCRETIADAAGHPCPTCHTPHHSDCWAENGGCTVFGCDQSPPEEPKLLVTQTEMSAPPFLHPHQPPRMNYYVVQNGQQFGPFTLSELQRHVSDRRFTAADLAWAEGMPDWVPLASVLGNMPLPSSPPPMPAMQRAGNYPMMNTMGVPVTRPQTYLLSAILVTLLCCLPFGIMSIVSASQVNSKFDAGDYAGAQAASDNAKKWYHYSLVAGLLVVVLSVIAQVAAQK